MKKVTQICFFLLICQLLFPKISNNIQKNIDKRIFELKEEFTYELKENNIKSEVIASYELRENEVELSAYCLNNKNAYFMTEVRKINNFNRVISKEIYFPQKKEKKSAVFFANLLGSILSLLFVGFVLKITYKPRKRTRKKLVDNKIKDKRAA